MNNGISINIFKSSYPKFVLNCITIIINVIFAKDFYGLRSYGLNVIIMRVLFNIWMFYVDGFRNMTVGKTLWIIIGIKLFIMFAILRLFFFPNFLKSKFENDTLRSEYVIEQLTK